MKQVNRLKTAVVLAVAVVAAYVVPASALTTSASWQNVAFTAQSGTFNAQFAAVPQGGSIHATIALSASAATSYDSCAALVRFNPSGMIDVWNGSDYAASASVPYVAGKTYQFKLVVNVPSHTYSVYVTPPGAAQVLLAGNYAFFTGQNTVTTLGNWAVIADSGSAIVGSFYVAGSASTPPAPPSTSALAANAGPDATIAPGGSTTLRGAASGGTAPYTYSWNPTTGLSSATVAGPTASPASTTTYSLTVRDASGQTATDSVVITVSSGGSAPSASWRNVSFASQSGSFTAQFAAVPLTAGITGTVGMSQAAAGSDDDCALQVRFNPSGTIDAWNGSAYAAATSVPYVAGKTYQFKLVVNVPSHTYNLYVTPPGAAQVLLASNYSFRASQAGVTSLANWAINPASGTMLVGSFYIAASASPPPPPPSTSALAANAGPDAAIAPGGSTTLRGAASGGTAPYTYSWNPTTGLSSATVAGPTASPASTTTYSLTVRDAAGQTATDSVVITVAPVISSPPPVSDWTPPIGIPTPPFGISESHMMYQGKTYAYSTGAAPYNDAGSGPYTHYVDSTSAAATDTDNPYGTVAKPRKTLPRNLAAGSVVEIHGGPYTTMETIVVAQGTAAQPVFIRGINNPRLPGKMSFFSNAGVESKYAIVEGLSIYKLWAIAPSSYLCFRNNDVTGDANAGGISVDSYNSAYSNHHLVFYNNVVHDNGTWHTDLDQDVHGITIAKYSNNIWILDNEMYHNSGDGLQINAGNMTTQPYTHHIYVGRNNSHHNKQAGLWSKQAVDVIFSQNVCHDLKPIGTRPSAWGAGLGCQYAPERIWFLYNHVYNCCFGISSGSSDGVGFGQDSYYIGNVIHDIHHDPNYEYNYGPGSGYSEAGMTFTQSGNKYIFNNTIYNCDAGINSPAGGKMVMVNNIVANITQPGGNHVFIENPTTSGASDMVNCLFYQEGGAPRFRWTGTDARSLEAVQTQYGKGLTSTIGDPLFMNPAGGDFRLQATSPAVDHGIVGQVYQTFYSLYGLNISVDYEGLARPQGGVWDIGACEYKGN